ncbi:MAG: hypothetical protein NQU48_01750 [Hadesarchaea archaeon]|nr:hypothetical protein [Hadesarchaea archaeon]
MDALPPVPQAPEGFQILTAAHHHGFVGVEVEGEEGPPLLRQKGLVEGKVPPEKLGFKEVEHVPER